MRYMLGEMFWRASFRYSPEFIMLYLKFNICDIKDIKVNIPSSLITVHLYIFWAHSEFFYVHLTALYFNPRFHWVDYLASQAYS